MGEEEEERYTVRKETCRPEGMLTKEQRRFLLTEHDQLDPQVVRQRRYRIRKRVKNGLLDFYPLATLPDEDWEQIFEDAADTPAEFMDGGFDLDVAIAILFDILCKGLGRDTFISIVEDVLESVYHKEYFQRGKVANVSVSVDVEVDNIREMDMLAERYEDGERLSARELRELYYADRITAEEYDAGVEYDVAVDDLPDGE